jgi:hypothetical protein
MSRSLKAVVSTLGIVGLLMLATGCGHEGRADLTPAMIRAAFRAEGIRLENPVPQLNGEPTLLVSSDARPTSEELTGMVFHKQSAESGVRVPAAATNRFVVVRNIVVSYSPRSKSAPHIRAAVGRLRKLAPTAR